MLSTRVMAKKMAVKQARQAKFTILILKESKGSEQRRSTRWAQFEMLHLANVFMTMASGDPKYPKYLILDGHFEEDQLRAHLSGKEFTTQTVVGTRKLPFCPVPLTIQG